MSFHTAHNQAVTVEISQQSLACQCMMTVAATHAPQIYFFLSSVIHLLTTHEFCVCLCVCVCIFVSERSPL